MFDEMDKSITLQKEIKTAFLQIWDPIGVGDYSEAQDEYDLYVKHIQKMLLSKASKEELFLYLWSIETEYMGLSGDRLHTEKFTKYLFDLKSKGEES